MSYEELTDRELDALVAEKVMGWTNIAESDWHHDREYPLDFGGRPVPGECIHLIPSYSTDDNAARLVRDRIAELDLIHLYRENLAKLIWPKSTPLADFRGPDYFAFRFEQATPRQQCIAALQAVAGTDGRSQ